MRKSSIYICVLAFLLVAGLTFGAQAVAAGGQGVKNAGHHLLHGKIVSMAADGSSMVVQTGGKNGPQVTVTFAANVVVRIDDKPATVAQLAVGDHVRVNPNAGNAVRVLAKTPGHHAKPIPAPVVVPVPAKN